MRRACGEMLGASGPKVTSDGKWEEGTNGSVKWAREQRSSIPGAT